MNSLFNSKRSSGFGMLDALIGILILSLVGVALHTTMTTGLQSTDKIRKKLLASWVGENRITEMKLAARYLQEINLDEQSVTLADIDWVTTIEVDKNTSSLVRFKIDVMEKSNTQAILYTLNTYLPASSVQ